MLSVDWDSTHHPKVVLVEVVHSLIVKETWSAGCSWGVVAAVAYEVALGAAEQRSRAEPSLAVSSS